MWRLVAIGMFGLVGCADAADEGWPTGSDADEGDDASAGVDGTRDIAGDLGLDATGAYNFAGSGTLSGAIAFASNLNDIESEVWGWSDADSSGLVVEAISGAPYAMIGLEFADRDLSVLKTDTMFVPGGLLYAYACSGSAYVDEATVDKVAVREIDESTPGVVTFALDLSLSWGQGQVVHTRFTVPSSALGG